MTRAKGRKHGGRFAALPYEIFTSAQYATLSARAVKLLVDLMMQFQGMNNGDLAAGWSLMRERGWTSKSQLEKAQKELEVRGWITRTRQGSINAPTLYALTFRGIDYCAGKLDVATDPMPSHRWRTPDTLPEQLQSRRRVAKTNRPALDTGDASPHEGAGLATTSPARRGTSPSIRGQAPPNGHPYLPRTEGTSIDLCHGGREPDALARWINDGGADESRTTSTAGDRGVASAFPGIEA